MKKSIVIALFWVGVALLSFVLFLGLWNTKVDCENRGGVIEGTFRTGYTCRLGD